MYSNFMHTLFLNKSLSLTTGKLAGGLADLATTNVCKVNFSLKKVNLRKRVSEKAHRYALAEETSINFNTLRKWPISPITACPCIFMAITSAVIAIKRSAFGVYHSVVRDITVHHTLFTVVQFRAFPILSRVSSDDYYIQPVL